MKPVSMIVCGILLCASSGWAQSGVAGKTGFAFLKIGVGGRGAALGDAFVAGATGAEATFWNPANLSASQNQIFFAHSEMLVDVRSEFIAVKFQGLGSAWALSMHLQNIAGIMQRTKASAEPLGEITVHDVAFSLSMARQATPELAYGMTVKYIGERLLQYAANALAFDAGVRYRLPQVPGLVLAVSVHNLGRSDEMLGERVTLPALLRAGLAYRLPVSTAGQAIELFASYRKLFQADGGLSVGVEYGLHRTVAVRAGYQAAQDSRGFSGGIGVQRSRYSLDYAYVPYDFDLGDTHRISLAIDL